MTRTAVISDDVVTAYARAVLCGEEVAGPHVRAAARRHLDDLESGADRGLFFNRDAALHALDFFPFALSVRVDRGYRPFDLLGWQAFVLGNLMGWMQWDAALGRWVRRYREAYIETGKGSGKSPLAAGIGLYMLVADDEEEPEIYAAASKKDQAMVLFRDAVNMVQSSTKLRKRVVSHGDAPTWMLRYPKRRGFFRPISSADGRSGPRPHCALIDELHEHKDSSMIEMMRAGFKGRSQPLMFMITNSGSDVQSVCYQMHDHAIKVAHGDIRDDQLFAYVCALDEGEDPLKSSACWAKANPSIGQTIGVDYLESQVSTARTLPARESLVRRLNFCQWTDAPDGWLTRAVWEGCEADISLADYAGRDVCLGIDLSYSNDLTAVAMAFPGERAGQPVYDLFVEFWKPADVLADHERLHRVQYRRMVREGHLVAPPGSVLRLEPVAERLKQIHEEHNVVCAAYDKYRLRDLERDMAEIGVSIPMLEHPQGFRRAPDSSLWMPESVQEMENAAVEGRIRTPPHPLLRWNVMSATVTADPSGVGLKKLDKRKSLGKIDGAVAAAMSIGAAKVSGRLGPARSVYETREPVVI